MRDLLIVGAGPVGLTLALGCDRAGVSYRLVEKLSAPSGLSKALALWSAAIEMLDVLGVADHFLKVAIHGRGVRISHGRRCLFEVPAGLGVDSPFPDLLLLPQRETEAILTRALVARGGVVERGVELTGLEQDGTGVRAVFGASGEEEFRWVVGCDGAHSTVRHLVGGTFEGSAMEETFVLCDAEVTGEIESGYAHVFWSGGGLLAMFPVEGRTWRVIGARSGEGDGDPTLEEVQDLLNERGPGGLTLHSETWLARFRISERRANDFRFGRVFLAGDAAHIHSPAGGQGMNTGMQDAFNLAWKLGLAKTCESSRVLETYAAERLPVAEKVLRDSGRMIRSNLPGQPILGLVRDGVLQIVGRSWGLRRKIARVLSGVEITYPRGLLVADDAHWNEDWRSYGFAPGKRVRDAEVFRDGKPVSLFREVQAPFFTLLLFSGRKPIYRDVDRLEAVRLVAVGFGGLVKVLSVWCGEHPPAGEWLLDPEGAAHKRFGVEGAAFYVVRPDLYVGLRCQPAEAVVLHEWLVQVTGERIAGDGELVSLPSERLR